MKAERIARKSKATRVGRFVSDKLKENEPQRHEAREC